MNKLLVATITFAAIAAGTAAAAVAAQQPEAFAAASTTASAWKPINKFTFDLSYVYNERTVHWPNALPFKFSKQIMNNAPGSQWYAANDFCVGEHGGTHLDAPYHFNRQGLKVGEIALDKLINKAYVLDVETYAGQPISSDTRLQPEHILRFEMALFGAGRTLPSNSIILIRFNWAQYYGTARYYDEAGGVLRFPGISTAAARLLVDRQIAGLGVDTASVDPGDSSTFETHRVLADANIFSMENVNITKDLLPFNDQLLVYALPMNIMEGTGAPVRVIAVVP